MAEKRRYTRVRPASLSAKSAKIVLDPKGSIVDCNVIDLSAGGACLELHGTVELPKRFEFVHGGTRKKCVLVWTKGFRLGVAF